MQMRGGEEEAEVVVWKFVIGNWVYNPPACTLMHHVRI
jgi:hypothetical protein